MNRMRSWKSLNLLMAILVPLTSGCQSGVSRWWYFGKEHPDQEHYRQVVSEVDYSNVVQPVSQEVESTSPPRTIATQDRDEVWDLSLQEAIHLALANNEIIRSTSQFLSPGNTLLANPNNVASIYDPAIQSSGVLFGGVGVEAALAAFDATWTNSLFFSSNDTVQNSPFSGGIGGGVLETDTAAFSTALTKQLAYGGQVRVSHDVNYFSSNSAATLFPSSYNGNVQAEYRQQLLAGAGQEFVKVAGPLSPQFASIAGVSNGVLIARINQDISITNFEANIRDLVKDVEDTYWDLYLMYRTFDTAVTARNTALRTWRNAKITKTAGGKQGFTLQDEAQSRDRYFETRAQAENTLGDLYVTEQRLRSLLGIAVNDKRIIRPANAPVAARIHADWYHCLAEALTERVELRRQKWNIKSLELQLGAARNFARPRLDFVARYRVNGFGDDLLGYGNTDPLDNMYDRLTHGNETGWDLGVELSMPIGLRLAKTQVQNIELRLTKARKVLSAQELEISHELAVAFQELERSYSTAISNFSRRQAAMDRFRIESALIEGGSGSIDMNLRAQESLATAANSYHQSLVNYNKAIVNLYYRKGTLLKEDNIHLMEGQWEPEAYKQAYARAKARANGIPAPHLKTVPQPFAADGQIPSYGFTAPEAAAMGSQQTPEMEVTPLPNELPLPMPTQETIDSSDIDRLRTFDTVPAAPAESAPENSAPVKSAQEPGHSPLSSAMPQSVIPQRNATVVPAVGTTELTSGISGSNQVVPLWAQSPAPKTDGAAQESRYAPQAPQSQGQPAEQRTGVPVLNESEGWQMRKEGTTMTYPGMPHPGMAQPEESPFTVVPVSYWQKVENSTPVQSPPAQSPPAKTPAQKIGSSIPSYRP